MHAELPGKHGTAFPFEALDDVNTRCLDLLTAAARNDKRSALPLVEHLRPLFRQASPELRRRIAQRGYLLLDMEFQNTEWWRGVHLDPEGQWRTRGWHEAFPRRTAVPLTRSTLMLTWHSVQADMEAACVLLGLTRGVAEVIGSLSPSELERIAARRHRHLVPRWHDRPAFWHDLFQTAQSGSASAIRTLNLHAIQLMTSPLLPRAGFELP